MWDLSHYVRLFWSDVMKKKNDVHNILRISYIRSYLDSNIIEKSVTYMCAYKLNFFKYIIKSPI